MKIVVFGPARRVGALDGDQVVNLTHAYAKYAREHDNEPHPYELAAAIVPPDLAAFIEGGRRTLDAAYATLDHLKQSGPIGLNGGKLVQPVVDVKLHGPKPRGSRIACAGGNYAEHSAGMARNRGEEVSMEHFHEEIRKRGMWGFWKLNRDAVGPEGEIMYPARTQRFDYEGEAAIILGKQGKDISASKGKEYVWGVTLLVDWSIRDGNERPATVSFSFGKNFDGSVSMGPCIVVDELDPENVDVQTVINGEVRQNYNTKTMVYSYWEYLEYVSRDLTLYPGDIISGGTAAGTAMDSSKRNADGTIPPDRFLKVGDVVEVSSPQIGTLRSRIVAKA
ncbi:MAG TPA: fumarylacetoacetate hydrolase family protein [Chloroflexota bacterium]